MVSVIVPVYNGEKYIIKCINSILNHVQDNYEIIIVDDGSSDETPKICDIISQNNTRIKVFHQENRGVSVARQFALTVSRGEWILFVDADDIMTGSIDDVIKDYSNSADWIIFSKCFENKNIYKLNDQNNKEEILEAILGVSKDRQFRESHCNTVWSKLYRKSLILNNSIEFKKEIFHGEDMLFNLEYLNECKNVLVVPKTIYELTCNPYSATHRYQEKSIENEKKFLENLEKILFVDYDNSKLMEIYYTISLNGLWISLNQYIAHKNNKMNIKQKKYIIRSLISSNWYNESLKNIFKTNIPYFRKIVLLLLKLNFINFSLFIINSKFYLRKKSKNEKYKKSI